MKIHDCSMMPSMKLMKALSTILLLAALLSVQTAVAQTKVALTFDDLPAHGDVPQGLTRTEIARKILAAMPDGSGAVMIEGKMQDDATWKQCKVMVSLAEMLAHKDPDLAQAYGFEPAAV